MERIYQKLPHFWMIDAAGCAGIFAVYTDSGDMKLRELWYFN